MSLYGNKLSLQKEKYLEFMVNEKSKIHMGVRLRDDGFYLYGYMFALMNIIVNDLEDSEAYSAIPYS
jgi:hypothetical protein